jgi:hypothetical protein
MPGKAKPPARRKQETTDVSTFLDRVASTPAVRRPQDVGRLIFAMDATASREPTWDAAIDIQASMFQETAHLGGLQVQLAYYRGFGEFDASPWCHDARALLERMTRVTCRAGRTQIGRVLAHARDEAKRGRVNALVFVGDCMEEDPDQLGQLAGELGLLGVPCFMFHEGGEPRARKIFDDIARLSGGACCRFDAASPQQLRELLSAVAVYAAGGRSALTELADARGGEIKRLTRQLS